MITELVQFDNDIEYLPYFADTQFWKEMDEFNLSRRDEDIIMVYNAICDVENYWINNKPTAFGNPDYSRKHGKMVGLIGGLHWDYSEETIDGIEFIVIRSGKRKIMTIQRPKKPEHYWDAKRENQKTLEALGL